MDVGKSLNGWIIREYREGDEEAILQLFRRAYGRECPPGYWRWKYREGPSGPRAIMAFEASGSLIGHVGGVTVPGKIGDRVLPICQFADLMVDPSARRGLRQGRVLWVLVEQIIQTYGNETRGAFLFAIPLPAAEPLMARVPGTEDLRVVVGLVKDLPNTLPGRSWRFRVIPLRLPDETIDGLWERISGQFSMAIIRNNHYLTWRYGRCPTVSYQCLGLYERWSRRLEGLAVVRQEFPGWPFAVLVDWLIPRERPEVGRELLAACERLALSAGRDQLFTWMPPGSPEEALFRAHGYRNHSTPYHIIASIHTPPRTIEWARGHWYYTPGDSDIF